MDWIIFLLLAFVTIILILNILKFNAGSGQKEIEKKIAELSQTLLRIESSLKEDFRINRQENAAIARDNRIELNQGLKEFRETMERTLKSSQESFDRNVQSFNNLQRERFGQMEDKQNKLVESTEKRLDQMRETVEEKLQKTLNERLGQSFKLVSEQLESVQKGLGEMQSLAQDVGGLKKVLSNPKLRGGIGEVQLAMLLEQVLAPEQYQANVHTKKGSSESVEFAIKLPGRDESMAVVYLPVDA
ncbi:MAG TPA: DNA recombination protein RmuC, partial [Bacteroidales bacterium]|nr:DNA recombination protein RmuC [Bacteroidales bacterium]